MQMHEDVRPFECSLCNQTFRQKTHLETHFQRRHKCENIIADEVSNNFPNCKSIFEVSSGHFCHKYPVRRDFTDRRCL